MMRILILTPQLPYPPRQGTTIRNYNLIAQLAARHQIHLLTFVENEGQLATAIPLQRYCADIRTVVAPRRSLSTRFRDLLLTPHPDMALRLRSVAFQRALGEILSEQTFDAIQVEGIELAQYLLWLRDRRPPGLPALPNPLPSGLSTRLVFDEHNAEYVLQQRAFETDLRQPARWIAAAYSFVQWRRLRRYEAHACRAADRVVAVSQADRQALRALVPGLEATVVPNGVDVAHYAAHDPHPAIPPEHADHALVFVGKMDFRPNVDAMLWFADEILPRIHQEAPEAILYIVGMKPHSRLERMADRQGIVITGGVPDVRDYIAPAAVIPVPLRMGGGTRLKVLEAMAMNKAIVSTTVGAEGLGAGPGRELLIADEPADFARAVAGLLDDPTRRSELGRAARTFVAARFDWTSLIPRFEKIYSDETPNPLP